MSIAPERTRKVDLLLHLISNLQRPIAVCGPEGIGKTTILKSLEAGKLAGWTVCSLVAEPRLGCKEIRAALYEALQGELPFHGNGDRISELSAILGRFAKERRKLVLLLDDAEKLAPGVLTEVCRFAVSNPALRLVLSITPNDRRVKASTDPAIDDCHFVEIPPLTEEQCGQFPKHPVGHAKVAAPLSAITPALVHRVYGEIRGVPEKILAVLLPQIGRVSAAPKITLTAICAGVVLMVAAGIAVSLFWKDAEKIAREGEQTAGAPNSSEEKSDIAPPRTLTNEEETSARFAGAVGMLIEEPSAPLLSGESDKIQNDIGGGHATADGNSSPVLLPMEDRSHAQPLAGDLPGGVTAPGPAQEVLAQGAEIEAPETAQPLKENAVPAVSQAAAAESGGVSSAKEKKRKREKERKSEEQAARSSKARSGSEEAGASRETEALTPALYFGHPALRPSGPPYGRSNSLPANLSQREKEMKGNSRIKDADWFLARNPNHYTLQVMTVRRREELTETAEKYPQLENLVFFRTTRDGEELYHLVSGVYPTPGAALAALKKLPPALGEGWVRTLKYVQSEIRSNRQ